MKVRKVTPELFYKVKQLGKCSPVADIASTTGLSKNTIATIVYHCEEFEDYLDFLETHYDKTDAKIREMHLGLLNGEPLFWQVHTYCRNFANKQIARCSNLSVDEVSAMKNAEDYESYIKLKKGATMPRYKKQRKYWLNEGVYDIICDGFAQGLSAKEIGQELPYNLQTLLRIKSGEWKPSGHYLTKKAYETIKANPDKYPNKQDIINSKDYYKYSLKRYARTAKVSWWGKKDLAGLKNESKLTNVSEAVPKVEPKVEPTIEPKLVPKEQMKIEIKPQERIIHKPIYIKSKDDKLKTIVTIWTMGLITFALAVAAVCLFRVIGLF